MFFEKENRNTSAFGKGKKHRMFFLFRFVPLCLCAFAPLFPLSSCHSAKIDVIQTGPWFPAKKTAEVEVFSGRDQVKKPFGGIAILHSGRFVFSGKAVAASLSKARKEAAAMGADAVIYSVDYYDKNIVYGERAECCLSSLAIKYVESQKENRE
ncbi:MAG: hypothetical protein COT17_08160 [Elusimicrobia bacterium CG08_land_8_20_14_0_20_51_18]|nr:MAG: hypothetical protein COT17_08160 [Elusimicrobia bacterium CG08_land_8_20_14_0_20_51_18]